MSQLCLTLNAGSSSLKFAACRREGDGTIARLVSGQVESLGPAARMLVKGKPPRDLGATDHRSALDEILRVLQTEIGSASVGAVGHRIVHGGVDFSAPVGLSAGVMEKLRLLIPLAPLHQPHNLACAEAAMYAFPDAMQLGCFDTGFHRNHPWVNDTFALPRRFYEDGVRRYGFHGLSYAYISSYLARNHPALHKGRVVVAHLGNGASLCAIREGVSVASTMGFSALDGLPMGTRCGQLDPGVVLYLLQNHNMDAAAITELLYRKSGLLGLSGISSDMRTLQASPAPEAREAIDYYVFRIQREVGAMAASLGGIDGLVFCGGIGENSALIREKITAPLGFLGIQCNPEANRANAIEIGTGEVPVMVIPTDEEAMIARACFAALTNTTRAIA